MAILSLHQRHDRLRDRKVCSVSLVRLTGGGLIQGQKYPAFRFGIWKDADPDIPILKQAKGEYAKLQ
jgi:hypothetical protein